MSSKTFRVRYWLQSMDTRSSPLFSTVRAYLLTDSLKRLIAESAPIQNGKLVFEAQLEEDTRSIAIDGKGGYAEGRATVLLEFGAQGRFIKMGEAQVDLGDILNQGKNGEVLAYRVEKCYDRNARINLGVTLWQVGGGNRVQRNEQMEMHSRSHYQLPPSKVKLCAAIIKNKVMATQYEQMTDRQQRQQQMSLVSDRHNSIGRTLNRTQLLLRKPHMQSQEVLDLKTENRIYQHQMAQIEQRLREAEEEVVELRQQEQACRREICRLGADCETLKGQLQEKDQMKQAQKEQLSAEVTRMLKLYQQSEMERNRLLLLREEESSIEKERLKEGQKRSAQDRNKVKQYQRSEESLKKRIEEYMSQIAIYDKALKTQQKSKQRLAQTLDQQMKINASLTAEIQSAKQSYQKLSQTNTQIQSELQISRFSFLEMEKELSLVRRTNKDLLQKLAQCETELKLSVETMRTERSNFSKKIHIIQQKTQREHRNMEAYLEQLEIKTSKEQTKNQMIATLRKEVGRLKQELANESERVEELQGEIQIVRDGGKQMQNRIQQCQTKILTISRQNALLQSQINSRRERLQSQHQIQQNNGLSEQQRQQLIAQSYQQRDQIWKKQLQAVENDTRTLMDKTKRQKQENSRIIKKLNEDNAAFQDSLKKGKAKIKDLVEQEERLKKNIKQLQGKCQHSQRNSSELKIQCAKYQQKTIQLQKKLQCMPQLQESLREAQQKITSNQNQYNNLKNDYQKQKQFRARFRSSTKELISTASSYLGKSQKQRIFYDQLHCQHIDAELLLLFNSSCKLYCDKHNRIRTKLDQLQELKGQLETKQKEVDKINKSLRDERRSQGGSCDSVSSVNFSQRPSNTSRALNIITAPATKQSQKDDLQTRTLKKDLDDLKNKLKKQVNRSSQLQREVERLRRGLQQTTEGLRRVREEADSKVDELSEVGERLKGKEKQLQSAKNQLRQMSNQVNSLKHDLQQVSKAFKQEKRQTLKRSMANRSFVTARSDRPQQSLKSFELQRKLRQTQDELQKLKREKDDKRNDISSHRQAKSFEARLKEKEDIIAHLRQNLEEQRQRSEQAKELLNLKMRKMKEQMQQEIELNVRAQKQAVQMLAESQQKLRQVQKKLKITEQSLKNANSQIITSAQREEKAKKMTVGQWQLKLKTVQSQLEAQLSALNKKIDQLKISERAARDGQRRKDKELTQAKLQLQRSERAVAELTQRLELCGVRLKNMEAEQSNYKEVIGALQNKIKGESQQSRRQRDVDRDTFDNHSTFSLKTFTFR